MFLYRTCIIMLLLYIDSTRPPLWLTARTTNLRLTRANYVCRRLCHRIIRRRHSHRPAPPPPQLPQPPWDTISRRPRRSIAGPSSASPPWPPCPRSTFRCRLISTTVYYDIYPSICLDVNSVILYATNAANVERLTLVTLTA